MSKPTGPGVYRHPQLLAGIDQQLILRTLFAMFAVAFVVQICLFVFSYIAFDGWEERGQFGDSFGFINSIFSGFALCGIIFSIVIQFREQARQRREARVVIEADFDTRKALVAAIESQTEELRLLRKGIIRGVPEDTGLSD